MKKKSFKSIYGLLFMSGCTVRIISLITLYRTITFPLLIVFIFTNQHQLFKWFLLVSFSTDAIDGYLARKYRAVSVLGAKLDSIGDDLTVLAALIAIIKMYPEFIIEQQYIIAALLVLYFVQLILSLIKYKKPTSFHTYSAKVSAVLQGVFLLWVFFFKSVFYPLFYSAVLVTALGLIEETILVLLLAEWKADIKGIYWIPKIMVGHNNKHHLPTSKNKLSSSPSKPVTASHKKPQSHKINS